MARRDVDGAWNGGGQGAKGVGKVLCNVIVLDGVIDQTW